MTLFVAYALLAYGSIYIAAGLPTPSNDTETTAFCANCQIDKLKRNIVGALAALNGVPRIADEEQGPHFQNKTNSKTPDSTAMVFSASPSNVISELTESLTLRCSHNFSELFEGTFNTSEIEPKESDRVVYIIISKATANGSRQVASMSTFDPPNLKTTEERLTVKGAINPCNISIPHGEVFLELTWIYPLNEHSGSYECEISSLSISKHLSKHRSSLDVKVNKATKAEITRELIKVHLESDRRQSQFAFDMEQLVANQLRIESGSVGFSVLFNSQWIDGSRSVTYSKPFRHTPETVISLYTADLPDERNDIKLWVTDATEKGFRIQHSFYSDYRMNHQLKVSWLSYGV